MNGSIDQPNSINTPKKMSRKKKVYFMAEEAPMQGESLSGNSIPQRSGRLF